MSQLLLLSSQLPPSSSAFASPILDFSVPLLLAGCGYKVMSVCMCNPTTGITSMTDL